MKVLKNNIIHAVLGVCIMFTNIQVKGMDDFVSLDEKRSLQEKIDDIKRYLDLPDSKKNPQAQLELLMKLYPSGHPYHEALVEVIKEKWLIAKKERAKKEQEVAVRTPIVAPVGQPQVRKNTIPSTNNNQHAVKQQVKVSPMPTVRTVQPMQDLSKRHTGVLQVGPTRQMQKTSIETASVDLGISGLNAANKAKLKYIEENLRLNQFFIYEDGTTQGVVISKAALEMSPVWKGMIGDAEQDYGVIPLLYPIQTIKIVCDILDKLSKKDEESAKNIAKKLSLEELVGVCKCLFFLDVSFGNKLMAEKVIQIIRTMYGNSYSATSISTWEISRGEYDHKLDKIQQTLNKFAAELPSYAILNSLSLDQQRAILKEYLLEDDPDRDTPLPYNIENYNTHIRPYHYDLWESGKNVRGQNVGYGAVRRLYGLRDEPILKSNTPLIDLINVYKKRFDAEVANIKEEIQKRRNSKKWFWQR